jgi:biopolymer transport protein ExbD
MSESWQIRHEGSPQARSGLTLAQIVAGLRDGAWEPTDEVMGPGDRAWVAIENHPQLAEVAADLEPPPPRVHEDETHLDMNALIDVCLVLLIFFMLTTSYAAAVQKVVPLPGVSEDKRSRAIPQLTPQQVQAMIRLEARTDKSGKPAIRVQNQLVTVFRDDGQTLDGPRLTAELRPYVQGQPHRTEMVLDAHDIRWGLVIAIQDAAKAAGVTVIHYNVGKQPSPKT